jgi:hypothetical protein
MLEMANPTTTNSYAAGKFEMHIDGHATTAYLKSISGGFVRAQVVDEPIGPDNIHIKHTSTVEIEPFAVELGLAGCNDVLKWIQSSWRKNWNRRSGQFTHADFDQKGQYIHEFQEALITETTFPTLDGTSKEPAYLKIKVQPERVTTKVGNKSAIKAVMQPKQKMWLCSAFRLTLEHVKGLEYANKIESFTVKQGIKKLYFGANRYPEIEPTKIEFPNIVGSISLAYADGLLAWYDKTVVKGQSDIKAQTTGALEFLSPDRKQTLFRIKLEQVGLHHVEITESTANQDAIKRAKFELYVGNMDIDGSYGF